MNALYIWILFDFFNECIFFDDRDIFGNQSLEWLTFLQMYMPQETKDFLTDRFLEPIRKSQRNDHYRHTDHRGCNRKPDNEPGE